MIVRLMAPLLFLIATAFAAAAQTPSPAPETSTVAQAPPAAVPLTLPNVLKAMVRLNAIDLGSDPALDDYARAVYCDLYQRYHSDEFTWRKVRAAMRTSIALHKNEYPLTFDLDRLEKIGQYDFSFGILPLVGDSVMSRTVYLQLYNVGDNDTICQTLKFSGLPTRYVAVLDKPLQFNGMPMSEEQAAQAVKNLDTKEGQRMAYGRFIVTLTSFMKLDRFQQPPQINVAAHLDQIELYGDAGYQAMIWNGQANFTGTQVIGPTPLDKIPFEGITSGQ
jgi:hypothetical protein